MPSVKANFAWSTVLTVAGYVFPLLTFPYVTRVLGVEGLGITQFAESVVSYFSLFAMLGIGTVGVREIAKAKATGSKEALSNVYSSLLFLNLIATSIAIFILLLLISVIPSFESHSRLLYIGIAKILFGALLVEWLFKGLENFRYITIWSIIIRSLYVISVFLFVRNENDYVTYFVLTTAIIVLNAVVNLVYSRRFVSFSFLSIKIKPYLKPFLFLGLYAILTNMYGSFNVVFLGSCCDDIEVGYYSTASKLFSIVIAVFTSYTTVMMPRMSALISEGKTDEFRDKSSKSIDFLMFFSVPVIIMLEVFAPTIIRIIAGAGYEGAIIPMRIVVPLLLVIGYEQVIVIQMLMPLGKDNIILINSSVGAVLALILNFTIVPLLASIGSAIVWCSCELAVALCAQYFVTRHVGYHFPAKKFLKYIVCYSPGFIMCCLINRFVDNWLIAFICGGVFIALYAFVVELFIIKNQLLRDSYDSLKRRLIKQ